jgi:hypothetical protein
MDTGFDENEAELRVFVFAVALKVLADCNSLYHHRFSVSQSLQGAGVKVILY